MTNQFSYLSGTAPWTSGAPWPCAFVRFLDELNSPFREGAFTLTGNGISVKDVHNLAVPSTTRGTLLAENAREFRRRPNKRQFGQHIAGPTKVFESSLWRRKGRVVVEYVEW